MANPTTIDRPLYKAITTVHQNLVFNRRKVRLSNALLSLIPPEAHTALDVGSGSGEIGCLIAQERPGLHIQGVDVYVRPQTAIPTQAFDGIHLPFADRCIDVLFLVDVIHHVAQPEELLAECSRVARKAVIIKDHFQHHALDRMVLRLMDWVGNESRGVDNLYRYYNEAQWKGTFDKVGLVQKALITHLNLYPFPASLIFERHLHFVALLQPVATSR